MLLLELQVLVVKLVDSIDHGLDQLHLGVAQAVLVGDVVGDASLATGLSPGAAGLQGQLLAALLQGIQALLGPAREINVDRGAHASAQVGGAGVEVAILLVEEELLARLSLDRISDSLDATGKTIEDSLDITALLHGDDAKLVLLIDPDKEGLLIIVVDAPALGPLTLHPGGDQVLVARHEEEVVINQLLAGGLLHALKGEVLAREVTLQLPKGALHESLHLLALLLGDARGESKSINAAPDTDAGRLDGGLRVDVALDLAHVHVRGVLEVLVQAMVLQDDGLKDILEVLVGVSISSIDAAVLVVELDGAGNGLWKEKEMKKVSKETEILQ